jgi:hypothetical protein
MAKSSESLVDVASPGLPRFDGYSVTISVMILYRAGGDPESVHGEEGGVDPCGAGCAKGWNYRGFVNVPSGWLAGGTNHASYTVVGAVAILPMLRHITRRRDAVIAASCCGRDSHF